MPFRCDEFSLRGAESSTGRPQLSVLHFVSSAKGTHKVMPAPPLLSPLLRLAMLRILSLSDLVSLPLLDHLLLPNRLQTAISFTDAVTLMQSHSLMLYIIVISLGVQDG